MGNNWKIVTSDKIGLKPSAPSSVYIYDVLDYALVFDPEYYLNHNSDLYAAFGNDWSLYYRHYIQHGCSEGRIEV